MSGGDKTITSMTEDLRAALGQMALGGQSGASQNASRRESAEEKQQQEESDRESDESVRHVSSSRGSLSRSSSTASKTDVLSLSVGGGGDAPRLDLSDFEMMGRLGEGAGGAVEKVKEKKSGRVMALKVSVQCHLLI
jgi:hypothetical protein